MPGAPVSAGRSQRPVRSFVRRSSRMTRAQRTAIRDNWSSFGLASGECLDLDAVFGRRARRVLEIGFGNGETLVDLARRHPQCDYLGIDVYEPGIGRLLAAAAQAGLANLRVLRGDASELLRSSLAAGSLDTILVLFPDPWPKKRHHKRRLIQAEFVELLAGRLEPGGVVHLATDWPDYAEHMLAVLEAEPLLENLAGPGRFCDAAGLRPVTKFERRGARLGHVIRDLRFRRRGQRA